MKKFLFIATLIALTMNVNAQALTARYCMTYADFVADNWKSIDELTGGRTKRVCQIKFDNYQYHVKTGDKEADAILKKNVLAVEYDGHLYVNCRNLRCKDVPLEVSNYTQAYRYDGNKLCIVAHWINTGVFLAAVAGDVVSVVAPIPVSIPTLVGSEVLWFNLDKLSDYRCYILDGDANAKGKSAITRITDEQMDKTLADNPDLLERYYAVDKKHARQSAPNILPFLKEKGLLKEKL